MTSLFKKTPEEVVAFFKQHHISRCYFIFDFNTKKVRTSHEVLQPLAADLEQDKRDYREHEGIFLQVGPKLDVLQGAFVHKTTRGQAVGGTRLWSYAHFEDFLRDGIRLSKGMTRKNALAGLWLGGGKGVLAHTSGLPVEDPEKRRLIFQQYGRFVTSLNGCYITAEDVGTDVHDMAGIFSQTRFCICIPKEYGGSGNPSIATASGVVCGMEGALAFLGKGTLEGKTIAVQGLGHVAVPMIEFLFQKGVKKVFACDIHPQAVEQAKQKFEKYPFEVKCVEPGDRSILFTPCDIVAPCATGAILNKETISKLQAPIVCGAANNQLEDVHRDGQALLDRGIVCVPDFLANRMGIVYAAMEPYGTLEKDPYIERHLDKTWDHSIYQRTLQVLALSKDKKIPTAIAAIEIADRSAQEEHPIYGHRTPHVIEYLIESHWENQPIF